jgi:hypothetical protein
MKTPDCVIWALTRKNNAHLVKFNGNEWTHNPLSITNMHNASSSANTLSVHGSHKADGKKFKRHFTAVLRHKEIHGRKAARSATSSAKLSHSEYRMSRPVHLVAKSINGFTYQNDKEKRQVLRRLRREAAANRHHV